MAMTCPTCGVEATGRFCSNCGAALDAECRECGKGVPAGARFCNHCGSPVASVGTTGDSGTGDGPSPLALIAGGLTVLIAVVGILLLWPRISGENQIATASGSSADLQPVPGPDPSSVDLSSMSPEEAALRLFNRVMSSVSAGDSASARQFAPMAISAYEMVADPTIDDRYHIAVLYLVNADPEGARAVTREILDQIPTHLFGLYTAAQAELLMGNREGAIELYAEFLDNFEEESAIERPEYVDHAVLLPAMFEDATRMVNQ